MARRLAWSILAGSLCLGLTAGCRQFPRSNSPVQEVKAARTGTPAEARSGRELPPAETARVCVATADLLFKKGQDAEAIALYERARQVDPSRKHVCRRLAVLYDRQGDYDRALEEYRKALELNPKDSDLLNDLGYCHYCRSKWAEAEDCLKKSVALNPKNRRAWVNLGLTLGQQGRYDDAKAAFEKGVSPAEAQYNLAFLYLAAGKRAEARDAYRIALALNPDLPLAQVALAKLEGREIALPRDTALANRQSKPAPAASRPQMQPARTSQPRETAQKNNWQTQPRPTMKPTESKTGVQPVSHQTLSIQRPLTVPTPVPVIKDQPAPRTQLVTPTLRSVTPPPAPPLSGKPITAERWNPQPAPKTTAAPSTGTLILDD